MATNQILLGDCLETLKTLPDCSVQTCVTSPPYYGLRDYGIEGQIGLEETPEAYVEKLVAVFREVKRVLKNDGTAWLVIGDSYWGGKGQSAHGGSDKQRARFQRNESINRDYQEIGRHGWTAPKDGKHEFIKPKDLIGIPWMVAFALRADGWWLRSDIIWAKPNPMPESVTDRPTKSHEYIFLFTKSARYYYDADAIAEPVTQSSIDRINQPNLENQIGSARVPGKTNGNMKAVLSKNLMADGQQPNSFHIVRANGEKDKVYPARNKRDVWTVTTKPYKEAHFATYPPDLIEPCILAGSRPGDTVLDPFNGSGTTGEVAIKHGRNYIGCELKPDYIEMTKRRFAKIQTVLHLETNGN
jgi:DNA modification methylase